MQGKPYTYIYFIISLVKNVQYKITWNFVFQKKMSFSFFFSYMKNINLFKTTLYMKIFSFPYLILC